MVEAAGYWAGTRAGSWYSARSSWWRRPLALQVVLPAVWSGFQVVGIDTSPVSPDGAANAAVLGIVLLAATTAVNLLDNSVMSVVHRIGVTAEIFGAVLIVALLFTHADRTPSVTVHGAGGTQALLVGSLAAATW